jgi:hypothetical protein
MSEHHDDWSLEEDTMCTCSHDVVCNLCNSLTNDYFDDVDMGT